MDVVIIGITGAVGGLLADRLLERGDRVRGLVRRAEQRDALAARGIAATVGELGSLDAAALAEAVRGADAIVFAAGSNGGAVEVTDAIDGAGVETAIAAARLAGVPRLALVSVLPESWRERDNGDAVEHYFAVKKRADVAVSRSGLDWLILRPSLLLDEPGTGRVSLGPAELHGSIPRADVAETLAALLHEPRIRRRILELDGGATAIADAVAAVAEG